MDERDRLNSLVVSALHHDAINAGYIVESAEENSLQNPRLQELGERIAVNSGRAIIYVDGREREVNYYRRRMTGKHPGSSVDFSTDGRQLNLYACSNEVRITAEHGIEEPITPNLPPGEIRAPGYTFSLVPGPKNDPKEPRLDFELAYREPHSTLFFRPVQDKPKLVLPNSTPTLDIMNIVNDLSVNDMPSLSTDLVCLIVEELDPIKAFEAPNQFEPVQIKPSIQITQEIAGIIVNALFPSNPVQQ